MFAGGGDNDGNLSDVVDIFIVPELLPGDATGDGVVSADDYTSVQGNFGNVAAAAGVVPEPATLSLLAVAAGVLLNCRRRG